MPSTNDIKKGEAQIRAFLKKAKPDDRAFEFIRALLREIPALANTEDRRKRNLITKLLEYNDRHSEFFQLLSDLLNPQLHFNQLILDQKVISLLALPKNIYWREIVRANLIRRQMHSYLGRSKEEREFYMSQERMLHMIHQACYRERSVFQESTASQVSAELKMAGPMAVNLPERFDVPLNAIGVPPMRGYLTADGFRTQDQFDPQTLSMMMLQGTALPVTAMPMTMEEHQMMQSYNAMRQMILPQLLYPYVQPSIAITSFLGMPQALPPQAAPSADQPWPPPPDLNPQRCSPLPNPRSLSVGPRPNPLMDPAVKPRGFEGAGVSNRASFFSISAPTTGHPNCSEQFEP
jgi:hypothetical protein